MSVFTHSTSANIKAVLVLDVFVPFLNLNANCRAINTAYLGCMFSLTGMSFSAWSPIYGHTLFLKCEQFWHNKTGGSILATNCLLSNYKIAFN